MWALLGRFRVARIKDMSMKLRLFQTLVCPIMEYCASVWSPDLLSSCASPAGAYKSQFQQVQNIFLRCLGGLTKTVSNDVLHRECCIDPVSSLWLEACIQLWGCLREAGAGSLLGRAARAAVKLAQRGKAAVRKRCWAGQLFAMLKSIARGGGDQNGAITSFALQFGWNAPARGHVVDVKHSLLPLPQFAIRVAWDDLLRKPWQNLPLKPREAVHQVKLASYHRWFAQPLPVRLGFAEEAEDGGRGPRLPPNMPRYIRCTRGIPVDHLKHLMRLRTGAHHLAVETGRWRGVRRVDRVCTRCCSFDVEDELHVLFECPAYHSVRVKYATALFAQFGGIRRCARSMLTTHGLVVQFMEQDPILVASFVAACMECRKVTPEVPCVDEVDEASIDDLVLYLSLAAVVFMFVWEALSMMCQWGPGLAPEMAPP